MIKDKNFIIHVRRRCNTKYGATNWGNDDRDVTLGRAKSLLGVIENDKVGPAAAYVGQKRFTGVKVLDREGNQIYCGEQP